MDNESIKILCIEDETPIRNALRDLLENSGYKVITTDNGIEGVKLIEVLSPDLILCDIMLPGLDGYQVLEKKLMNEQTRNIPFLFLTAKAGMQELRRGMNLGADDYVTKPFTADDLLNSINARLEKTKYNSKNNKKKAIINSSHIFLNCVNQPKLLKLTKIKCIEANGIYSNIILANNKKITHRKILKEWEQILDANYFIRIHRSTIININYIQKIQKFDHRTYTIQLRNFHRSLSVSQRYSSRLKESFLV